MLNKRDWKISQRIREEVLHGLSDARFYRGDHDQEKVVDFTVERYRKKYDRVEKSRENDWAWKITFDDKYVHLIFKGAERLIEMIPMGVVEWE